ncbi:hypothetical protein AKO1_015782 [Acrasis kona]|uniref:CCR4-NOT transcription complex subunit 3 n=1 Tax=Acrasis kona TaxID=1008807 RepID=A0AAW2ZGR6_9EUKA
MEKFKLCEQKTKMKAYSKEALSQKQVQRRKKTKIIPETPEKRAVKEELESYIETLNEMIETIEGKLTDAREARKPDTELINTLEDRKKKNFQFLDNLEQLKVHLEDDEVKHDDVTEIKDSIEYYIDSSLEPDFQEDPDLFNELFEKAQEAKEAMGEDEYEDEYDFDDDDHENEDDDDHDDDDDPSPELSSPKKQAPKSTDTAKKSTSMQPPVKVEPIKSQPQTIPARKNSDASPLSSPVKKQSLPDNKPFVAPTSINKQTPPQTTTILKPPLVPPSTKSTIPSQITSPLASTIPLIINNDPKQTKAKQANPNLKVKVPPSDSNHANTSTPKSAPIQPNVKSVPQPNTPLTAITSVDSKKNSNPSSSTSSSNVVVPQIQQQLQQLSPAIQSSSPSVVNNSNATLTSTIQKINPSPTIKQPLNQPTSNVVKSHVSYIDMAKAQTPTPITTNNYVNVKKENAPKSNQSTNPMFEEMPTNMQSNHDITILSNSDSKSNQMNNVNLDAEHQSAQLGMSQLGLEEFSFNTPSSSSHVHPQGIIAPPSHFNQSSSSSSTLNQQITQTHPTASLFTPTDGDWTNSMLEASLNALPGGTDCERPRAYVPLNECVVPDCFPTHPPSILGSPNLYANMDVDTLFFIFYFKQGTYQQYLAAKELKRQAWRYHRKYMTWFQRHDKPRHTTNEFEHGTYRYFDYETGWCQRIKSGFRFEYQHLEDELPVQ